MRYKEISEEKAADEIAKYRNICFFLGAGAAIDESLPEGLRLYLGDKIKEKLLEEARLKEEELKERLGEKLRGEELTPEIVWGETFDNEPPDRRFEILQSLFEYRNGKVIPVPSSYRFIAKLLLEGHIKTLLTTNFEEKLEKALNEQIKTKYRDKMFVVAADDTEFEKFLDVKTVPVIYKFHGTQSRFQTIVSAPQPNLSEKKKKVFREAIKNNDCIVFVGYSGRDKDIRKAFSDILREEGKGWRNKHVYWCLRSSNSRIHSEVRDILEVAEEEGGFHTYYPIISSATTFLRKIWRKKKSEADLYNIDEDFCVEKYGKYVADRNKRGGFSGYIIDPIYGRIEFPKLISPEIVKDIGNLLYSGAIQHMRGIKQLSLGYVRYPDAMHTRFSHSLGVAWLATKALNIIKRMAEITISDNIERNCIIAALLHDIGHGPFSHVTETFMMRLYSIDTVQAGHEKRSIDLIKKGILDLPSALEKITYKKDFVLKLLDGSIVEENPEYYALSMLISNNGFDVDRLDFVMRDLYHSGRRVDQIDLRIKPYSIEERKRLIDTLINNLSITIIKNLPLEEREKFPKENENVTVLCFKDKKEVRECLNDFFKLYIELYDEIYYAKQNRAAQSMLSKAMYFSYEAGETELEDIHALTDSELFTLLENSLDNRVRELTKSVKYRFLFELISEFEIKNKCELEKDLSKELGIKEGLINLLEKKLCKEAGVDESEIDKMINVDILPPKRIDDRIYLRKDDGTIVPYKLFKDDEIIREEAKKMREKYENLKKWRGYIFVPYGFKGKIESIREYLESLEREGKIRVVFFLKCC